MTAGMLVYGIIIFGNGKDICHPAQQTEKIKVEGNSHAGQGVCNHQKIQGFKENLDCSKNFLLFLSVYFQWTLQRKKTEKAWQEP